MRPRTRTVVALAGLAALVLMSVWALRACGDGTGGGPASAGTHPHGGAADAAGDVGAPPVVGTTNPSSRGRAVRPSDTATASGDAAVLGNELAVPSRDARVTFVVRRSEDRTSIEGARVFVHDAAGHRELVTDRDGQAEVELVAGDVDYGVVADGRARRQFHETFAHGEASEVLLEPGAQAAGRVTDAATGAPIAEATVEVRVGGFDGWDEVHRLGDWEVGRATTDAEGRFRVEGLAPDGVVTLRAWAAGYAPEERPVTPETTGPCVADVALSRSRTVRFQVLDENGAPLASACVVVSLPGATLGSPFDSDVRRRLVDREGRCVVPGLRRDAVYEVRVHRGDPSDDVPAAPDFIDLSLRPGPEHVERVIHFQAPARLRVLTSNADGTPREGEKGTALLSRAAGSGDTYEDVVFDRRSGRSADGRDAWVLQPGRYRVQLLISGRSEPDPQEVVLAPGEDRLVEFRLAAGVLEGRVVDPERNSVRGGTVFLLCITDPLAASSRISDGAFHVTGLTPGRWRMFLSGQWGDESGFVAADVDVPSEPREWRLVRDPTARIRLPGTAVGRPIRVEVDGPPMPQQAAVDGWSRRWEDGGDVQEDGTFALLVQSDGPLRFRIRVEGFLPVAVETPAPSGEDFDVVVPALARGIDVVGRVVDAAGSPVKSSVEVLAPAGFGDVQWGTAQDGGFRIPGLPPGPVLLAVRPERHRAERSVRVTAREGMDPIEVVVSRGGTLDVLCTDARGVPLPGRVIEASAADPVEDGPLPTERTTDARGRAQFRVHPGTWRVRRQDVHAVVELAEGATTPVRLVVR